MLRCPAPGWRLHSVLTEGDLVCGDFVPSLRLRGTGRLPGTPSHPHCHLASRSGMCSSPPAAPPAQRGISGCITPISAEVSVLSPSSQPPKSPAASPGSGVHPSCWHRATRWGCLSPGLSLQADGRHQLPGASFHDSLSRPLPFRDTSSHGQ